MPDPTRRPRPPAAAPAPPPPRSPTISDAEWEVMKVVWDRGPLSAGDVVRHLADCPPGHPARRWRPRTVKTLLSRLVRKGAVSADGGDNGGEPAATREAPGAAGAAGEDEASPGGRRFLYAARVARDRVVRQETRSFLARVFDGSVAPALLHFLADARLTPDEIDQLRRTLDGQPAAAAPAHSKSPDAKSADAASGKETAAAKQSATGRPRR